MDKKSNKDKKGKRPVWPPFPVIEFSPVEITPIEFEWEEWPEQPTWSIEFEEKQFEEPKWTIEFPREEPEEPAWSLSFEEE